MENRVSENIKKVEVRVAVYWSQTIGFTVRMSKPDPNGKDLAIYDDLCGNAIIELAMPEEALKYIT
jgi:hypothetical protein